MNSKKNMTLVPTICGFLISLVGIFIMFFGDKNVVLPSAYLMGSIVACFGMLYAIGQWAMIFFYRLEKLEKTVELWEDTKDERTDDP